MRKILYFLLFSLLVSCVKKGEVKEKSYPVKVAEAIQKNVFLTIPAIGKFGSIFSIDIQPQIQGILTNSLFKDGALVNSGDLLITIDDRPYQAALEAANAKMAITKAKLKYANDFAETYGTLVGKSYVARLDYSQGVQNVEALKAEVEANLAEIKQAEINLGYTKIYSTIRGYIGVSNYDPGNLVSPTQQKPLASLFQITPISVNFSVSSDYLDEIRTEQDKGTLFVEAYLDNDKEKPLKGSLTFIDNHVNEETGMVLLKAAFANEDERGWPGKFARVKLFLKELPNSTVVPSQAIILGEESYFVFVVKEDNCAELRKVTKIDLNGETVILSGVSPQEKVVIDGQLNLSPNVHVTIVESDLTPKEEKTIDDKSNFSPNSKTTVIESVQSNLPKKNSDRKLTLIEKEKLSS